MGITLINPSGMVSSGFGISFIEAGIVCLQSVGTYSQVIDNRCVHNTDFKSRYVPISDK